MTGEKPLRVSPTYLAASVWFESRPATEKPTRPGPIVRLQHLCAHVHLPERGRSCYVLPPSLATLGGYLPLCHPQARGKKRKKPLKEGLDSRAGDGI